jgi:hypothetical protein
VIDFEGDTSDQFTVPDAGQLDGECAHCRGQLVDEYISPTRL